MRATKSPALRKRFIRYLDEEANAGVVLVVGFWIVVLVVILVVKFLGPYFPEPAEVESPSGAALVGLLVVAVVAVGFFPFLFWVVDDFPRPVILGKLGELRAP